MPGPVYGDSNLSFIKKAEATPNKYLQPEAPISQLGLSNRYSTIYPGVNSEERYAQQQSTLDKWGNGLIKMVGLAGTTFLSGTVGLINGIGSYMGSGRFADLYDNSITRSMDEANKWMEDALPNYYTKQETDASWYSPDNILTANFWSDKVLKNLGFSIGAIGGGFAWGSLLKGIGLTNRLVQAGKGMEMVEAVENAVTNAPKLERFGAINSALDNLGQKYIKNNIAPILTNSERGIVSIMGTAGEASMEALGNMNEFRNSLIQQYKNTYGVDPVGEDLDEINAYSDRVGNFTWGMNVALLSATNYIQLPKILGSSKTLEKRGISEIEQEAITNKWVKSPSLLSKAGAPGKFIDKFVVGPGKYLFAPPEAFEEGAQFAIQKGTEDYFNRAYQNKDDINDFFENLTESLGSVVSKGVRDALTTKEGLENILIGGISGGLQQARGTYIESRATSRNTTAAINALNSTTLGQQLKDGVKYAGIAINSQKLRQQAIENNDTLNEKDYEKDYALAYILPRVKYGKVESIYQEIGHYRNQASTEQGFNELVRQGVVLEGETKDKFIQRLNQVENTAKEVNKTYEMLNDKYSSYIDKDGNRKYNDEIIDKMTYAFAKVNDYDQRLLELSIKLQKNGVNTSRIQQTILGTTPYKEGNVAKALDETSVKNVLEEEVSNVEKNNQLTPEDTKADLGDFTEMILLRQEYLNDFNNLKKNPEQFKSAEKQPYSSPKSTGKKIEGLDLEIGEEYFAEKRIRVKETNDEVDDILRFKVIKQNEDGSIQIQTPDGKIINASKKAFEGVFLEKTSGVTSDNAKFVIETHDNIFTYNRGGGKKVEGRLLYNKNNDTIIFKSLDGKFVKRVTRDQFSPKGEYKVAQIYSNKKFTKLAEEISKKPISLEEKLAVRNEIISSLYETSKKRLDEVQEKLTKNKERLSEVADSLDNLYKTKEGLPRKKFTKAIRKTIDALVKTKNEIETEINQLESEKEELEITLPYFQDLMYSVQDLSEDDNVLLSELKEDIKNIDELIDHTNEAIEDGNSLIKKIESSLETALSLLNDFIKRLKEENPNVPLAIGELQDNLEKFLGEEGAKQFIQQRLGFTDLVIDLQDQIDSFAEELNIPELSKKIESLKEQIKDLEEGLNPLIAENIAKQKVLEAFQNYAEKIKQQKAEEERLKNNKEFVEATLGTMTKEPQTLPIDHKYEADSKKTALQVVTSTIPTTDDKPHHKRLNRFGINFYSFTNRKRIKGIFVTSKNEDQVLPGLTTLLKGDSDVNKDEIIALVFVEEDPVTGEVKLVGEDGKKLDSPTLDNAVYGVFPDSKLQWSAEYGNKSMFREGEDKALVEAYKKQYSEWRQKVLDNPSNRTYDVDASFGIPDFERDPEGKRTYEPTSVDKAGLVSDSELSDEKVIHVSTTEGDIAKGGITFKNTIGRVFLELKNGFVKLQNRKLNKKEATAIFQAIHRLSVKSLEDPKFKSDESVRLLNWLKSIIYWGIPKNNAGYNSVWFTADPEKGLMLNLSGKGVQVPFTPTYLLQNKDMLIALLGEMYNNVNATLVNGKEQSPWSSSYEEVTSVSEDGKIESTIWDNYQTYLLSNKGRSIEDIPLTTQIRALKNEEDVNRRNIYFTVSGLEYNAPEKKQQVATPVVTPAPQKGGVATEGTMVFDGKTLNIARTSKNEILLFTATMEGGEIKTAELSKEKVAGNQFDEVLNRIIEEKGVDPEAAIKFLQGAVQNNIVKYLQNNPQTKEVAPAKESKSDLPEIVTDDEEIDRLLSEMGDSDIVDADFRVFLEESDLPEDWTKLEKWLSENFPNIPIYRVKNIIKASNGREAWGMLQNGAIYLYKNAEIGTIYHEVFEAVWKMFTDKKEQSLVEKEFKSRKGTFIDRPTGRVVKFSEASSTEIKEQLAEEFRDFILNGKLPQKSSSNFISRIFKELVSFFREFFLGEKAESNTEKLFKKIGSGYYKQYSPYTKALSFAEKGIIDIDSVEAGIGADFRLAHDISHAIMEDMTYGTVTELFKTNKSLFHLEDEEKINRKELYERLKTRIENSILSSIKKLTELKNKGEVSADKIDVRINNQKELFKTVRKEWESLKEKHSEYLKVYNIEFDENDDVNLKDENNSGKSDYQDATKIDNLKKASSAIKLLLATLPQVNENDSHIPSATGGVKLLSLSEVWIKLLNKLHSSRNVDEMVLRLKNIAKEDVNYRRLYNRLTKGNWASDGISYDNMDEHDSQLLANFFKVMKKQNPDVKNLYIFSNGEVQVGDSQYQAREIEQEINSSLINLIKNNKEYFVYDENQKAYIAVPNKIKKIGVSSPEEKIAFLKFLNIPFTLNEYNKLNSKDQIRFNKAVVNIHKSLLDAEKLVSVSGKVLNIKGRIKDLAVLKAISNTSDLSNTFFNVDGEMTQSFIGVNITSNLYDALSQIDNLEELIGTNYEYLLNDSFAQESVILKKMFDSKGNRIDSSFLKPMWVDGTVNEAKRKRKQSSKLTFKERFIQEINMNLEGYYGVLVPGDASMEHMIYMGNHVSADSFLKGWGDVDKIFKGYFIQELKLAREGRNVKNSEKLRFFEGILGDLSKEILKSKKSPEEVYSDFEKRINAKVKEYIESESEKTKQILENYGILALEESGYELDAIGFDKNAELSKEQLDRQLNALSANFMINNIELHKLVFSDPYQYSDELKRIKNFLSPRQPLIQGSNKFNSLLNKLYNKGFKKGEIGYTDFTKNHFKAVTLEDVVASDDVLGYKPYDETDGSGIITYSAYRNMRIRAADWGDEEESQYRFDMEFEKLVKEGASQKQIEEFKKSNPKVKSAYTPLKPIVSGNKADGNNYNDVVMDKFALYPLSFRIMSEVNKDSNALKLYNKMMEEGIDYAVFASGRKVGAKNKFSVYNKDGSFNTNKFSGNEILTIPFSIMGIQAEVPSKDEPLVSRGTQLTKLATLDYMEAGVPIDYLTEQKDFSKRMSSWIALSNEEKKQRSSLYAEILNNQKILQEITKYGYEELLSKLGLKETSKGYEIDKSKAFETIREEILKREVNDNIYAAINGFFSGDTVLEATPAYQQIRNILYSIVDKNVISPKMSGGMKVQIPSTLMESTRVASKEINGKQVFTSDILKFYRNNDGERVCEIMIGRWFDSDMNDEELLKYLNENIKEVLTGIGYRIPTQKQNSIDRFVIKQFLPKEFGDSVVVPSALVAKAGSDFDIDKLTVYLKNVTKGKFPKLLTFSNIDTNSEEDLKDFYEENLLNRYKRFKELEKTAALEDSAKPLMESIFEEEEEGDDIINRLQKEYVPSLDEFVLENKGKDVYQLNKEWGKYNYKKVLQNEYIKSLENLVSRKENFEQLTSANSADPLKKLSKDIVEKSGGTPFDYGNPKNYMSRAFMTSLRHAFVSGKYAIGIAAVNQTNQSLTQRSPIYIDIDRFDSLSKEDQYWLSGGTMDEMNVPIKLPHNTIQVNGKNVATLSMIFNQAKDRISDLISQFIDGYVDISKGPWIMEMGATPNVASTWLFLVKIGVPMNTIGYFMNQPIIKDYLRTIESAGYSWLFIDSFAEGTKSLPKYKGGPEEVDMPTEKELWNMLGKKEFSPKEAAQQRLILNEFLKYARMASHLFSLTQGSNFDTASFNDPLLIYKKIEQLKVAKDTIISSVNDILDNSFVGEIFDKLIKSREALAEILVSDKLKIRDVVERVLKTRLTLTDREFVKVGRKAVTDILDWLVQTNAGNQLKINELIEKALVLDDNYAKQLYDFILPIKQNPRHPLYNNQVIKLFTTDFSGKKGGTNTIKIKNKQNKVYDQNQLISAFEELRTKVPQDIYSKIVRLAIIQSGLSNSPISFTNLLPYEDFKKVYNEVISNMDKFDLEPFIALNVFERNNWADEDIVPSKTAAWIQVKGKWKYNPSMQFLPKNIQAAIEKDEIQQIITVSPYGKESNSDVIVYTWEVGTKQEKTEMKKKGDFSYIKRGLFKKVYSGGEPLLHTYVNKEGKVSNYFIYKAINAWGDSYRANEFYDVARQSVIDNGFIKVTEHPDEKISSFFPQNQVSSQYMQQPVSNKPEEKNDNTPTPIEGLNERLKNYGFAKVILPNDFYEGNRPKGRLNAFKASIAKVADNIMVLENLDLTEFDFLSDQDKKRLDALKPLAQELARINTNDISLQGKRTVAIEKRYAYLSNYLTNEFIDIIGKHVEKQLGKKISSSNTKEEKREYTPENITSLNPNEVFVFGSNTEGKHGKGAALTAKQKFGAKQGQAEGLQGQSYAIITKDLNKGERSIPLKYDTRNTRSIQDGIERFLYFARQNPDKKFYVTKLGSSLAGYSVAEIKDLFKNSLNVIPENVILPKEYEVRQELKETEKRDLPCEGGTSF